jgi:hypothetical protein
MKDHTIVELVGRIDFALSLLKFTKNDIISLSKDIFIYTLTHFTTISVCVVCGSKSTGQALVGINGPPIDFNFDRSPAANLKQKIIYTQKEVFIKR